MGYIGELSEELVAPQDISWFLRKNVPHLAHVGGLEASDNTGGAKKLAVTCHPAASYCRTCGDKGLKQGFIVHSSSHGDKS